MTDGFGEDKDDDSLDEEMEGHLNHRGKNHVAFILTPPESRQRGESTREKELRSKTGGTRQKLEEEEEESDEKGRTPPFLKCLSPSVRSGVEGSSSFSPGIKKKAQERSERRLARGGYSRRAVHSCGSRRGEEKRGGR